MSTSAAYEQNDKNTVKQVPKRAHYEKATVNKILDSGYICHVSFVMEGRPFLIPTTFGRDGDTLYLHGSTNSRMLKALEAGIPMAVAVTHVDAFILAKSLLHHSMNYRSVIAYGTGTLLPVEEREQALMKITDHIISGRSKEARGVNANELKATAVIAMPIDSASAKIRSEGVNDDKRDVDFPVWTGVVPVAQVFGTPEPNEVCNDQGYDVPPSVWELLSRNK